MGYMDVFEDSPAPQSSAGYMDVFDTPKPKRRQPAPAPMPEPEPFDLGFDPLQMVKDFAFMADRGGSVTSMRPAPEFSVPAPSYASQVEYEGSPMDARNLAKERQMVRAEQAARDKALADAVAQKSPEVSQRLQNRARANEREAFAQANIANAPYQRDPLMYAFQNVFDPYQAGIDAFRQQQADLVNAYSDAWNSGANLGEKLQNIAFDVPQNREAQFDVQQFLGDWDKNLAHLQNTAVDTPELKGSSNLNAANYSSPFNVTKDVPILRDIALGSDVYNTQMQNLIADPTNLFDVGLAGEGIKAVSGLDKARKVLNVAKRAGMADDAARVTKLVSQSGIEDDLLKLPVERQGEYLQEFLSNVDGMADGLLQRGMKNRKMAERLASKTISGAELTPQEQRILSQMDIGEAEKAKWDKAFERAGMLPTQAERANLPPTRPKKASQSEAPVILKAKGEQAQEPTRIEIPGQVEPNPKAKLELPPQVAGRELEAFTRAGIDMNAVPEKEIPLVRRALSKQEQGKLLTAEERATLKQYEGTMQAQAPDIIPGQASKGKVLPVRESAMPTPEVLPPEPAKTPKTSPFSEIENQIKNNEIKIYRIDNVDPDATKPHGAYYSIEYNGFKSPHIEDYPEGKEFRQIVKPKNPLKLEEQESRGSGVIALKHLDPDEYDKIYKIGQMDESIFSGRFRGTSVGKNSVIKYLSKKYPNIEWNRYYDVQEIMEAVGGIKAREKGFDTIININRSDPDFSEVIVLDNALINKSNTSQVLPAKPPVKPPVVEQAMTPTDSLPPQSVKVPEAPKEPLRSPINEPVKKEPWQMTKEEYQITKDEVFKNLPETEKPVTKEIGFKIKMQEGKVKKLQSQFDNKQMPSEALRKNLEKEKSILQDLKKQDSDTSFEIDRISRMDAEETVKKYPQYFEKTDSYPYVVSKIKDHKKSIEQALKEGKPVPSEVLAEYPDLAKASKTPSFDIPDTKPAQVGSKVTLTDGSTYNVKSIGDNIELLGKDGKSRVMSADEFRKMAATVSEPELQKLEAGIGISSLDEKTQKGIIGFLKRHFSWAGNTPEEFKNMKVTALEDIYEGRSIGLETGEKLAWKERPRLGKSGEAWSQDVQHLQQKVLTNEVTDWKEFKKLGLNDVEAKQVFRETRQAAEEMQQVGRELSELGGLDEETFLRNEGKYSPRMYRRYEYHTQNEQTMKEIARKLRAKNDPQAQKWAEIAERAADESKQQAFELAIQQKVMETAENADLVSDVKKQGYTYVRGEDWVYSADGKQGLSGKYVRNDVYEKIKTMMDNAAMSRKELQRKFVKPTSELSKGLDQSYLKRRKDLSDEYREYLGEILEPAYPVAKRLAQMKSDLAKLKFYRDVVEQWGSVNNLGKNMELFEGKKWGKALDGKYLPMDIARQIKSFDEQFTRTQGFRNDALDLWKEMHTVWNPATHSRNTMSNMINMGIIYDGLNPTKALPRYVRTLKHFARKDSFFDIARRSNLFSGNFNQELGMLLDNFDDLEKAPTWQKIIQAIGSPRKQLGKAYSFEDNFFKMAAFEAELEKKGVNINQLELLWPQMSAEEKGKWIKEFGRPSSLEARDAIVTYDRVPDIVRKYSRLPVFGDPFISYTYSYATRTLPKIARSGPAAWGKFVMGVVLPMVAGGYAANKFGESGQQEVSERPSYMRSKFIDTAFKEGKVNEKTWTTLQQLTGGYVPLPAKDKYGRKLYLQAEYITPWMSFIKPDNIPVIDVNSPIGVRINDPLAKSLFEISANKDLFTKKPIFLEGDSPDIKKQKAVKHLLRATLPQFAPGGYSWEKVQAAQRNATDYKQRARGKGLVALDVLLGIKITPSDPQDVKERDTWEAKTNESEIKKEIRSLKRKINTKQVDPKWGNEQIKKYQNRIRELREQFKKMHPQMGVLPVE